MICDKCNQVVQVVMPSGESVSIEHIDRNGWTSHRFVYTTQLEIEPEPKSKPKTVIEKIRERINNRPTSFIIKTDDDYRAWVALAEAVEAIENLNYSSGGEFHKYKLDSILAILRGEKTRSIPKS